MNKHAFLLGSIITLLSTTYTQAQENDSINQLKQVEIFGDRNTKQRGLETITRFPGSPQD